MIRGLGITRSVTPRDLGLAELRRVLLLDDMRHGDLSPVARTSPPPPPRHHADTPQTTPRFCLGLPDSGISSSSNCAEAMAADTRCCRRPRLGIPPETPPQNRAIAARKHGRPCGHARLCSPRHSSASQRQNRPSCRCTERNPARLAASEQPPPTATSTQAASIHKTRKMTVALGCRLIASGCSGEEYLPAWSMIMPPRVFMSSVAGSPQPQRETVTAMPDRVTVTDERLLLVIDRLTPVPD